MSKDFVYGPRPRKQLGHPRQWYSHMRLASASRRSAPDYNSTHSRPLAAVALWSHRISPPGAEERIQHPHATPPSRPIAAVVPRSQRAPSPSGESTTSTHTRHSRALHHVARSTWHCPRHTRRSRFIVRLSHNKRVLTRPCVALTASTAAGMTYGPTTILMSAPLPANAVKVRYSLGLLQQWHLGLRALLLP